MALALSLTGHTLTQLFPYLFYLFLLFIISRSIYRRTFHPLAPIPGPFWASITRLHRLYVALQGSQHLYDIACHEKYGPVVRIAPNTILVSDPQYARDFWTFHKSDWWLSFALSPESGVELDEEVHKKTKKRVAGGFSLTQAVSNEDAMDQHILTLVEQLKNLYATTGKLCDFANWAQWAAFDIVMDMAFSAPPGFLKQGKDVGGLIASIHQLLNVAQVLGLYPEIVKCLQLPIISDTVRPKPTDKTGPGALVGVAQRAVRERYSGESKSRTGKKDILQWIKDFMDRDGESTPQWSVERQCVGPVVAGSDTTAAAIRAGVLYISTNPPVLRKMMQELDQATRDGCLSSPAKYEELRKLPYLEAVFKELIRIHPVVGGATYRWVPPEGRTWGGYHLPGRVEIGMNQWVISRNRDLYGEDVERFRPERWLEGDEQNRKRQVGDYYFGGGSFVCLGKNIATMELYKIIAELFRNFEITVVNPPRPWHSHNALAFYQTNFWLAISPRDQAKENAVTTA